MTFSLIISDVHLCQERKDSIALFERFLKNEAKGAEKLYILGDFFEFWIGDDDLTVFHQHIMDLLKKLVAQGTQLYVMHGNRDFLLGKRFLKSIGAQFLKDPTVIDAYGQKLLLLHGDSLCINDLKYQRYRRIANQKWIQWLFLRLPLSRRRKIALKLRDANPHKGIPDTPVNEPRIADVDKTAAIQAFDRYHVDTMIHGHTHRLALHYYPKHRLRVVLGDWHSKGSYVRLSKNIVELNFL